MARWQPPPPPEGADIVEDHPGHIPVRPRGFLNGRSFSNMQEYRSYEESLRREEQEAPAGGSGPGGNSVVLRRDRDAELRRREEG
jgi:hypothetical protein